MARYYQPVQLRILEKGLDKVHPNQPIPQNAVNLQELTIFKKT